MEKQNSVDAIATHQGQQTAFFKRIKICARRRWQTTKPGQRAWKGAAFGLLIMTIILWLTMVISLTPPAAAPLVRPGLILVGLLFMALVSGILVLGINLLKSLPTLYGWALLSGIGTLALISAIWTRGPVGALTIMLAGVITASLAGAGAWVLINGGLQNTTIGKRVIAISGLIAGLAAIAVNLAWLLNDGWDAKPLPNAAEAGAPIATLKLPDPSQLGNYKVQTLFYGNGTDRHRPEYGNTVDLVTEVVDGSAFVDGWEGIAGWALTNYWGFDLKSLPLNARVWYPDGKGPFPLALIVHGNHPAEDFSDSGYNYLGELLASQGFIIASVDENFLNTTWVSIFGGLEEEDDARGWLLLEHLRVWRKWNQTPGNPFYQKVDMDNIGLIGHSRGGEAVAIAAAFNRLSHYPDNAAIAFDYNFNIRAVAALAPVDGKYHPAGVSTPLENVNYLVLQGANDGDISSFAGAAQYERVAFTNDDYWFKAALYIYGANHDQFNTTWGRGDSQGLGNLFLNLRPLMPAEEQEQIAKVYISAFFNATLRSENSYIPLFRDYRSGAGWLPDTIYLSQFADSTYHLISAYEEDLDVATTTLAGGAQDGENLTIWREQTVKGKWETPIDTRAVFLGWDAKASQTVARYTISLPERSLAFDASSVLFFSMADAGKDPNPKAGNEENQDRREPIDLTIELGDAAGQTARLPLSHFSSLQPQIQTQLMKAALLDDLPPSEIVFQLFEFKLADFAAANPDFDPVRLTSISFIFDRTQAGVVALDDVGFRD